MIPFLAFFAVVVKFSSFAKAAVIYLFSEAEKGG
jgi:hypothetical protein